MCAECFTAWSQKKDTICPKCRKNAQPKPMMRVLLDYRNETVVTCKNQDCSSFKQQMSFSQYKKHMDKCLGKKTTCP